MKLRVLGAALAVAVAALAGAGAGGAGPDPGYGFLSTVFTGSGTFPFAVATDGQDSTLVAGFNGSGGFVERFTGAGLADATFGAAGTVSFANQVPAVAADSNDRVVVVGGTPASPTVSRLTSGGAPDQSFGTAGSAVVAFAAGVVARGIAVDGSDRPLVLGANGVTGRIELARFLTGGTPDTTFGGTGVVDLGVVGGTASLAIGADGRIFVGSTSGVDATVTALLPSGVVDTTFGTSGRATIDAGGNDAVNALAVDQSDDIVVGGTSVPGQSPAAGRPFAARLDSQGALDSSFGTGGIVLLPLPAGSGGGLVQGVAVGPGGRVAIAAPTFAGTAAVGALYVLDSAGAPDGGYVAGGLRATPGSTTAVAFDGVGRLLLAGQSAPPITIGFVERFIDSDPDTTPPVIQIQSVSVGAVGSSGAPVTYTTAVFDDVDVGLTATCTPTSGSVFPLGTTTISCSATDTAGNVGSASTTVTVDAAPVVHVPASPVTAEATSPSGAVIGFSVTADVGGVPVGATCSPASGATFPVGATTVSCSAQAPNGTVGTATFVVDVVDTTAPTLTLADVVADATGPSGTTLSYTVSAADLVDGAVAVTCTPPSGATFAIGDTTVSCGATDTHGNQAVATFVVHVRSAAEQFALLRSAVAPYAPLAKRLKTIDLAKPRAACTLLEQFARAALKDPGRAVGSALAARARRIEAVLGGC